MKYLKYENKTYLMTEKEEEDIHGFLTAIKKTSHFNFRGQAFKTAYATIVDRDEQSDWEKPYDLNVNEDRDVIKDLEKEIEGAMDFELKEDLIFYGKPIKVIPAFNKKPEIKLSSGYVKNEILGLVHWSLVEYCLKNNIIKRKEIGNKVIWEIVYPDYKQYEDKRNALNELKGRREFMNKEETDSLTEDKDEAIKQMLL